MSSEQSDGQAVVSPTEAHLALLTLLHEVVVEVAWRRQDDLPGLVETLQDDVVLTTGGTSRRVYGWFADRMWRLGDRKVHELFLNADHRHFDPSSSPAEQALVTLLHECCHVWAQAQGIKDTSRDGRYHNKQFAQIALVIGLGIEKDKLIGHRTPGLASWARTAYADLATRLDQGLVLSREPQPADRDSTPDDEAEQAADLTDESSESSSSTTKYVFASCQCRDVRHRPVTIRVARGSWRQGVICCAMCDAPFASL